MLDGWEYCLVLQSSVKLTAPLLQGDGKEYSGGVGGEAVQAARKATLRAECQVTNRQEGHS